MWHEQSMQPCDPQEGRLLLDGVADGAVRDPLSAALTPQSSKGKKGDLKWHFNDSLESVNLNGGMVQA